MSAEQKSVPGTTWTKSLAELWPVLRGRAYGALGRWEAVVLPHGACVGLRVRPEDMRKELRISREKAPADEKARGRWESELATFLKHFPQLQGGSWERRPDEEARARPGGVAALFLELWPDEVSLNVVHCTGCNRRIPRDPMRPKGQVCSDCSLRETIAKVHGAERELDG